MDAVKLEGGQEMAPTVRAITDAGIAVMGHIGLTPQSVSKLGGWRTQGTTALAAHKLLDDAIALEDAGCFAIVVEKMPDRVAELITARLTVPTIGIGAGPGCDGQVLVTYDLLGLFDRFVPKFAKQYAQLNTTIGAALGEFKRDVENKTFPAVEHSFSIKEVEWTGFLQSIDEDRKALTTAFPESGTRDSKGEFEMKIGILGTGAMGSLFAAKLAPHAEIIVLGTWLEGVRALQTRGVRLNSGGIETIVPVRALADPQDAPKMDLVLVLVKGYQTQRAAQWARTILKTDGIALTLQNGLGNFEIIGAEVGINRAAVGVSMQGATLIKPGYVCHAGSGPTTIAHKPETHDRLSNVAALFNLAGIETLLTDDLRALIWGKLVVNSAINALYGYSTGAEWMVSSKPGCADIDG